MEKQGKKALFVCCAVIVLVACSEGKLVKQEAAPETPHSEYNGHVKQVIEIDHSLLTPELFAITQEDFDLEALVDYQCQELAAEIRTEKEAEELEDDEDAFEFYYDMPWAERFFNDEDDAADYAYSIERFDKDGFLTFYGSYRSPQHWSFKQVYTRDENHRTIKEEFFNDEVWSSTNEFQYNADGFVTRSFFSTADGTKIETRYTYDELNYLTAQEEYRKDTFYNRTVFAYDQFGNKLSEQSSGSWDCKWEYDYLYGKGKKRDLLTEIAYYSPSSQLENRYTYRYSKDLSELDEYQINGQGDTVARHHYCLDDQMRQLCDQCTLFPEGGYASSVEYDDRGNMISNENEGSEPWNYFAETVRYDDANREIERTTFNTYNGPLNTRTVTSYDAQGNKIKAESYLSVLTDEGLTEEQLATREIWEYDAQGNWINQETYYFSVDQTAADKGHLVDKKTREIEYYE